MQGISRDFFLCLGKAKGWKGRDGKEDNFWMDGWSMNGGFSWFDQRITYPTYCRGRNSFSLFYILGLRGGRGLWGGSFALRNCDRGEGCNWGWSKAGSFGEKIYCVYAAMYVCVFLCPVPAVLYIIPICSNDDV